MRFKGNSFPVAAHFLGLFNVENFLCAVGAMISVGFEIETVLKEAVKLMPPAGRMQIVREDRGPIFAVDYSHTPDAVTQAINALEGLAKAPRRPNLDCRRCGRRSRSRQTPLDGAGCLCCG